MLVATDTFCDHADPSVVALSRSLMARAQSIGGDSDQYALNQAYAIAAFNWVRDEIKYKVLHNWTVPVSYTLKHRHGNCSTKSCLLVALYRAVGIEAAFCVGRINTIGTFFFVPTSITSQCNGQSIHFSVAAKLNNTWLHLDATTDWELAVGMSGVAGDTFQVTFDGQAHAVPRGQEVFGGVECLPTIASYMHKTSRVSPQLRQCFNQSAEFCRAVGIWFKNADDLSRAAEAHLAMNYKSILSEALPFRSTSAHEARLNALVQASGATTAIPVTAERRML